MIKPADIQEKEFTKVMRGYKEEEVNEFLDQITIDMDNLMSELRETQEENNRLVSELERIRESEGSLVETLTAAKSLMADISASADKRAEVLLKNAELDAELMRKSAREDVEALAKETQAMRDRFLKFRNSYKSLLESELHRFESLSGELLPELGVDDFDDLPEPPKPAEPKKTDTTATSENPVDPDSLEKTYRNLKY